MKKYLALLLVGGLAVNLIAADSRVFKTPAAIAAMHKYDAATAKAKAEYERAIRAARDTSIKELGEALKAATRAGDLKEANAIDAQIAAQNAVNPAGGINDLQGTWEIAFENGQKRTYRFNANDSIDSLTDGKSGKAIMHGSDLIAEVDPGRLERFSVWRGRLMVEHWIGIANYPDKAPDHIGIGTRKTDK